MHPLYRSAERELAAHQKSARDVLAVRTADGAFAGSWEDFGDLAICAADLVVVGDGWWLERGPFWTWRFVEPPLPAVGAKPLAGAIDRPERHPFLCAVYLPDGRRYDADPLRPREQRYLRWWGPTTRERFVLESFMVPTPGVDVRLMLDGERVYITDEIPAEVLRDGAIVPLATPVIVFPNGHEDSGLSALMRNRQEDSVSDADAKRPCVVLLGRMLGLEDGEEVGRLLREARRRRRGGE